MFWSANYIAVREVKFLLKEENVTLTQVLEADDILQECKADNAALTQFLTKPEILAELITLVTEEPPKNVDLASQYRHASIASEVIASNPSMLRDRLSINVAQMNRLCDFVNKDPPLNPLLASYFSKTVEVLLQRNPMQDWYLHHIVCLRVLDFFKSRREFLPNLLRHISTSAICDTIKCILTLTDPSSKIIIEWLDEHQFLESLIQVICGTYELDDNAARLDSNHNAEDDKHDEEGRAPRAAGGGGRGEESWEAERRRGVAAANAAALLCEPCCFDSFKSWCGARYLWQRLRGEEAVRRLLQGVFTSPPRARRAALVHACRLLCAMLRRPLAPPDEQAAEEMAAVLKELQELEELERAIAPHLPLLHHALLHGAGDSPPCVPGGVGAERVATSELLAALALSTADDVPTAIISLGTAGVLVDMLFAFPHNNFLHANVCAFVRHARNNPRFADRYTTHLIDECELLTRLMDAFEEHEEGKRSARAGYMGHAVVALRELARSPPPLREPLQQRWDAFHERRLRPLLERLDAPLGGFFPCENTYEVETSNMTDTLEDSYDFNSAAANIEVTEEDLQLDRTMESAESNFLELAGQRYDDNMWDDTPDDDAQNSPWEGGGAGGAGGSAEGWAHFDNFAQSDPFWPDAESQQAGSLERGMQQCSLGFDDDDKDTLTILLAQKMLTAFHSMAPQALADHDRDHDHDPAGDHDHETASDRDHESASNERDHIRDSDANASDVTHNAHVTDVASDASVADTDSAASVAEAVSVASVAKASSFAPIAEIATVGSDEKVASVVSDGEVAVGASDAKVVSDTPATKAESITPVVEVASVAPVAEIASAAPVREVAPVAKVASVAPVAEVASVTPVAEVASVTPIAEVAPVAEVANVAPVAPVAEVASVTEVTSVTAVAEDASVAVVAEDASVASVSEDSEGAER